MGNLKNLFKLLGLKGNENTIKNIINWTNSDANSIIQFH